MFYFLHRHVLLPAFESGLKRRNTFRYWRRLERSQWLTPAELEQSQFEALTRLIAHAFTNCPYYREAWMGQGLEPSKLQAPRDFRRWPVIDRHTIGEHRLRMRAAAAGLRLIH